MRYIVTILLILSTFLQAAPEVDTNSSTENNETNLSKIYIPVHYKDYDWDIGVIGGLTFDGTQIDYQRYTLGTGIHAAYHYNEYVTFHGEYVKYFKTIAASKYDSAAKKIIEKATTTNIMAASVAFDFSAERTYSLFAKAGLGYEFKDDANAKDSKAPVSLMGFGFRYQFTNHLSGYIEGRWKMRLTNISEPDNSLIGTTGLDYHFGLSDEKSRLIVEADEHNKMIDNIIKQRVEKLKE